MANRIARSAIRGSLGLHYGSKECGIGVSAGEPMAMLPQFGSIAPWSPEDTPVPRDGALTLSAAR
jgi:hypothetical protein